MHVLIASITACGNAVPSGSNKTTFRCIPSSTTRRQWLLLGLMKAKVTPPPDLACVNSVPESDRPSICTNSSSVIG